MFKQGEMTSAKRKYKQGFVGKFLCLIGLSLLKIPVLPENKLFLLDAMALIYRAYYAFKNNPRVSSKGVNTSAVFGFANTLFDVLRKEKPSHLGVAFDTIAPTARHEGFAEYKANRQRMPEDLAISIPYIKRLIEAFNIPTLLGLSEPKM